jgi:methylmalonyl-CoA mutase N-terminal domain/subunit
LAGSYYLEWLTRKIEKEVNKYLDEVEERGGIFECLESGWLNDVMESNRLRVQREKAEGNRLIVGVNAFQEEGDEGPINNAIRDVAYKVPSVALREQRVREVIKFKENRNQEALKSSLKEIYRATKDGRNLTRPIIEAAKTGATLGEVTGLIRLGYVIPYDPFEQIDMPSFVRQLVKECE